VGENFGRGQKTRKEVLLKQRETKSLTVVNDDGGVTRRKKDYWEKLGTKGGAQKG